MATYDPHPYVEPLGFQPVEFLDLPSMAELTSRLDAREHRLAEPGAPGGAAPGEPAGHGPVRRHRVTRARRVRST